jgi:hypothetical protein
LCTNYYLNKEKGSPYFPVIFETNSAFAQALVFSIKIITVFYYFFIEFATLFEKLRIELLFKKRIRVRNPDVLPNLKQIGSVILDKNQTIMKNSKLISSIVTASKIYQIKSPEDYQFVRSHLLNSNEVPPRKSNKLTTLDNLTQFREENDLDSSMIPNENNDIFSIAGFRPK